MTLEQRHGYACDLSNVENGILTNILKRPNLSGNLLQISLCSGPLQRTRPSQSQGRPNTFEKSGSRLEKTAKVQDAEESKVSAGFGEVSTSTSDQ